jgi:hypothetical protein
MATYMVTADFVVEDVDSPEEAADKVSKFISLAYDRVANGQDSEGLACVTANEVIPNQEPEAEE